MGVRAVFFLPLPRTGFCLLMCFANIPLRLLLIYRNYILLWSFWHSTRGCVGSECPSGALTVWHCTAAGLEDDRPQSSAREAWAFAPGCIPRTGGSMRHSSERGVCPVGYTPHAGSRTHKTAADLHSSLLRSGWCRCPPGGNRTEIEPRQAFRCWKTERTRKARNTSISSDVVFWTVSVSHQNLSRYPAVGNGERRMDKQPLPSPPSTPPTQTRSGSTARFPAAASLRIAELSCLAGECFLRPRDCPLSSNTSEGSRKRHRGASGTGLKPAR